MPAVMPAEVQIVPSRTKMRSGSTCTAGYSVLQPRAGAPMGGGATAVEQAGGSQQEGAGADAGDPVRPLRSRAHDRHGLRRLQGHVHAAAARHDEGIAAGIVDRVRGDRRPGRGQDRAALRGDEAEAIAAGFRLGGKLERRQGATEVQQLEGRKQKKANVAGHGGNRGINVV